MDDVQADYKADKTVYCLKHAQKYASKPNHLAFIVDRLVTIHWGAEEEAKRRLKSGPVDFRQNCGSGDFFCQIRKVSNGS